METFTPIAMKCTQEQFEAVRPKLIGLKITSISPFSDYNYLVNNLWGELKLISNIPYNYNGSHNRKVYEEWNEKTFLKACGIETEPTLIEKLQKAEAEVKRLKEAIEDSKIKIGDWITFNNGSTKGFDKVEIINSSDYNIGTQFCYYKESECKKITNPELIKLLEQEIK